MDDRMRDRRTMMPTRGAGPSQEGAPGAMPWGGMGQPMQRPQWGGPMGSMGSMGGGEGGPPRPDWGAIMQHFRQRPMMQGMQGMQQRFMPGGGMPQGAPAMPQGAPQGGSPSWLQSAIADAAARFGTRRGMEPGGGIVNPRGGMY